MIADIAPKGGDGIVDFSDLVLYAQAWMPEPHSDNWNYACDIAEERDNKVNFKDFAVFSNEWNCDNTIISADIFLFDGDGVVDIPDLWEFSKNRLESE